MSSHIGIVFFLNVIDVIMQTILKPPDCVAHILDHTHLTCYQIEYVSGVAINKGPVLNMQHGLPQKKKKKGKGKRYPIRKPGRKGKKSLQSAS